MRYLLSVAVSHARDILPELERIGVIKMNTVKPCYTLDIASDVNIELIFVSPNTGVCFIDVQMEYHENSSHDFILKELITLLNNNYFKVSESDIIWYRII